MMGHPSPQTQPGKRCGILSTGSRLLADTAPAHWSQVAVDKARACDFEILQLSPYSPYLTPSEFSLFPKKKNSLRVQRFDNLDDLINEVEGWFQAQSVNFHNNGTLSANW